MRYFYWLIPLLLLSSCASVYNGRSHRVTVRTNSSAKEIEVNNEKYPFRDGETFLWAVRNKVPLVIKIKTGDSLQQVAINSSNSFNYLYDVVSTAGIMSLVEGKNPKRYFYQKNIYLEQEGDIIKVRRFAPVKKGTVNLTLSFPYGNSFVIKSTGTKKHKAGFLGITSGLEYFYKENKYLSIQAGAAINHDLPVPFAAEHPGIIIETERVNNLFASIRHNHVIRSFDIGYGISFSGLNWHETKKADTAYIRREKNTTGFGASFITQYRLTKNFRVGLLYQPTLFSFDNDLKPDYQHLLSVELVLKFRLKKGTRFRLF